MVTRFLRYIIAMIIPVSILSAYSGATIAKSDKDVTGRYTGHPVVITSSTLKVLSLNLAHGRKNHLNQVLLSEHTIRRNLDDIGGTLKSFGSDFIALQEADGSSIWSGRFDHVQYLASQGGYAYYANANHSSSKFFTFGTAFLSNVPLQNVRSKTFEPSPPTLNKGLLTATILWNPDKRLVQAIEVDLVSVHLDFSRSTIRKKQAQELIAMFIHRDKPLIILGDLNATWAGKDPTVRDIVRELNLRVYQPDNTELGTYRSTGSRLDWILISDDLVFNDYVVLPDILSDHFAIGAEIGLGPSAH